MIRTLGPVIARALVISAVVGVAIGGLVGTFDFPIVGTAFGAVYGAFIGAAIGVVTGAALAVVAARTAVRLLARVVGAAATLGCWTILLSFGHLVSGRATWYLLVVVAGCTLAAGGLGPSIAFGPALPGRRVIGRSLPNLFGRVLAAGAGTGAVLGGGAGLVIGAVTHLPTAPFALVEGAILGAVCGVVLAVFVAIAVGLIMSYRPSRAPK